MKWALAQTCPSNFRPYRTFTSAIRLDTHRKGVLGRRKDEEALSVGNRDPVKKQRRSSTAMDREWGSKPGSGGAASAQNEAIDRRERLRRLALETIDLAKDPYFMRNHLGRSFFSLARSSSIRSLEILELNCIGFWGVFVVMSVSFA